MHYDHSALLTLDLYYDHSALLTLDLYFKRAWRWLRGSKTFRPKITFCVIKQLSLTHTLCCICIDKHIGMTNIKKKKEEFYFLWQQFWTKRCFIEPKQQHLFVAPMPVSCNKHATAGLPPPSPTKPQLRSKPFSWVYICTRLYGVVTSQKVLRTSFFRIAVF